MICSISLPEKITWFCVFIQCPFRMPTINHFRAMIFVWWFFYCVNHRSWISFAAKGIHIGARSCRPITARCTCRKIRARIRIVKTFWFIFPPLIIIFLAALQLKTLNFNGQYLKNLKKAVPKIGFHSQFSFGLGYELDKSEFRSHIRVTPALSHSLKYWKNQNCSMISSVAYFWNEFLLLFIFN